MTTPQDATDPGLSGGAGTRVQGGSRGFTAFGAGLMIAFLALVGVTGDAVVTGRLGWGFAVGFGGGCLWAALRVRPGDWSAALVAPPLVYAVVVLVASQIGGAGGKITDRTLDGVVGLAHYAPILVVGLVIAALTLLVRRRTV